MCETSNKVSEHIIEEGCLEDNSHADTCMLGKGFYVTPKNNITCDVSDFTSSLGTMCLEIIDAEIIVTDSRGDECILIIHQGI